ncbi:hypothetical protein [Eikenella longinqua]|uniref:hypothetical protein n=1 Tax=Eikenella longinqua TaxID=1795827 RepID=UPI0012E7BCCC|nr:hypothetical protein [Eikenella longinqua]
MLKKHIIALLLTFPLIVQAESCLNYGCVVLWRRQAYDEAVLPQWNQLKKLVEKQSISDREASFILNHYQEWRDISLNECEAYTQEVRLITQDKRQQVSTCVSSMIDRRVLFLKQKLSYLRNNIHSTF